MPEDDRTAVSEDLVKLVEGPASDWLCEFSERCLNPAVNVPTNEQVLDAALRSGYELSTDALVRGALRPSLDGNIAIATFARLRQQSASLAGALAVALNQPDLDQWRLGGLANCIAELGGRDCPDGLVRGLKSSIKGTRLASMRAIGLLSPRKHLTMAWNDEAGRISLTLFDEAAKPLCLLEMSTAEAAGQLLVRNTLAVAAETQPVGGQTALVRCLLKHCRDDAVRLRLIEKLSELGDFAPLPAGMLSGNNLFLRRVAIERWRRTDERAVIAELLKRIGQRDGFYALGLGRIPLQESDLTQLRGLLSQGEEARRQGAGILAMQDQPQNVLRLLMHPDAVVRRHASDCGVISSLLRRQHGGFPVYSGRALEQQIARKNEMLRQLAAMPVGYRQWRLSMTDITSGGWGRWSEGMRGWILEQRYQLSNGALYPPEVMR